jgi:uncharacterized membrane protein YccC
MRSIEPAQSVGILCALLICLVWSAMRPGRISSATLVASAFAWILFNGPIEGPILWELNTNHGFTASDALSVVSLAVAVRGLWRTSGSRAHSDTKHR